MDDETEALALRRLLLANDQDPVIRARWARYQLVRSALQGDLPTAAVRTLGLADRVKAELINDTVPPSVIQLSGLCRWLQPIASLAVAASITLVSLLVAEDIGLLEQDILPPLIQEGVVLVEPHNNENLQLASSSFGASTVPQAQGKVLRLNWPSYKATESAPWQANNLPAGFVLLHRQTSIMDFSQREHLTYSDGIVTFSLIIEHLLGRQINEGYATVGTDLVLGRRVQVGDQNLFVTLVGQLSLEDAEQMVASIAAP